MIKHVQQAVLFTSCQSKYFQVTNDRRKFNMKCCSSYCEWTVNKLWEAKRKRHAYKNKKTPPLHTLDQKKRTLCLIWMSCEIISSWCPFFYLSCLEPSHHHLHSSMKTLCISDPLSSLSLPSRVFRSLLLWLAGCDSRVKQWLPNASVQSCPFFIVRYQQAVCEKWPGQAGQAFGCAHTRTRHAELATMSTCVNNRPGLRGEGNAGQQIEEAWRARNSLALKAIVPQKNCQQHTARARTMSVNTHLCTQNCTSVDSAHTGNHAHMHSSKHPY